MSIMLMSRIFRMNIGGCNRKLLAVRLADFADDDGRGIYPGVDRLSQETELSERTVQRILADFEREGILVCRQRATGRPGVANRYDFDLDRLFALDAKASKATRGTGDSVSPVTTGETGDNGAERGDTDDREGCHGDTRTVIEPPIEPSEREGACEPDGRREPQPASQADGEDDPKSLMKRLKALEVGYKRNPWPNVLASSSDWALKQFAKLSSEERRLAEERRDAYLAVCPKDRNGNPKTVPLGVYLRDRKFLDVEAITPRATAKPEAITVAPFGPIWAALRELAFIDGPVSVEMPVGRREATQSMFEALSRTNAGRANAYLAGKGISLGSDGSLIFPDDFEEAEFRRMLRDTGYPEVVRLHELAGKRERTQADARFAALGDLCEPVPVGSALFEEWRRHDQEVNRPFVPNPGNMPVVYFPKGGPAGLAEFERAARAALAMERGDEHAA